ncbi:TonB-dependent receptor domain-containing protein [Paludibacterium denitrificans]|uniref:TonB-dependent receptor n=1 Tax=Paludibacterium denitrificans TaxID=2675226 RepID=A0A844GD77_9NEIS|nr:TonB-dependent receptor [Paludibacterium denitrificans]MTD33188.1 TonB-dependent receptor [Paludibacterium denitrificans]
MFKPQQLAVLVPLACASLARANDTPQFRGDEVVVTATRQPQAISKTLSDVTVITREEIDNSSVSTLPQLLARQPGMEVVSSGGVGSPTSVFMRGTNSNHVVVLVDGVRIVSATLPSTTALANIPLSVVERVEILRGNSSSLYGADAIGGVIQIFTRQGSGKPRFNFNVGVGDHGMVKVGGGVDGKVDNTAFSLQLSQQTTDGISATNKDNTFSYNPDRDGYRNLAYSANLTQTLATGHDLSFRAFQSFGKVGYDASAFNLKEDLQRMRQTGLSLESRNAFTSNWTSTLRYSRSVDRQESWTGGDMVNRNSLFQTSQNDWLWQNDLKTALGSFLLGADYTQQRVDSQGELTTTERHNTAFFGGYSGEFGQHLLQANVRHDQDEQFGGKTTGVLGYGYRLTDSLTARASFGTAFKAPTFDDLYYPDDGYYSGNPNLKPETSRNSELALSYHAGATKASVTAFHNSIDNLITYVTDPVTYHGTMMNVNKATITGVTLAASSSWGNWDLSGSATYQDPKDDTKHLLLLRRSRAFGQLAAGYDWGKLTTGIEWSASAKRRDYDFSNYKDVWLGGYSLTNLYANYRLSKTWTATARVTNLFERRYTTAYGYNTQGLGGFIGVNYQGE